MIFISPKISIIVPAYNEEKHIARCLDSILNQTFTDFEVICVDDGSTDNTFDILSKYAEKDTRILPYKNIKGKGVSSARNYGIELSKGEYIGFVDSDDFIQPQMYEFLYKAAVENNSLMSVCHYKKTSVLEKENFNFSVRECLCDEFISFDDQNFCSENELVISSVCTKLTEKNYLLSCGKFENFRIGEDTVFCSKLWTNTDKISFVDAPLYCYYNNTESVSYTKLSDEKWFDLLVTRFISYDNYKNYKTKNVALFFLERGMKNILSYRFNIKGTENEKIFKEKITKLFRKYIKDYLSFSEIKFKNKISVLVFFYFPLLYNFYRKLLDKTIR